MHTVIGTFSSHVYFEAAGKEFDLVRNIQWVRESDKTPKNVNVLTIERGLKDLFRSFYPELNNKTQTVLVLYNGENEGDWRVSVLMGISEGVYNKDTSEHLAIDVRITKPGNKVEYACVSEDGELLQSFTRYENEWTVL